MFGVNDVLHAISQALMIPAEVILVCLLIITVILIGSLIVEAATERRFYREQTAKNVNAIHDADYGEVCDVIEGLHLLRSQKDALLMVARNMGLSDEELFSLAKVQLARLDDSHQRSVRRTDLITKVGPMMGLICTLIPLGPGIVAMGNGQVDQLSQSMLVAFDGTVSGLVAAVVAMFISNIRKRWYKQYALSMEAVMNSVVEKAAQAHEEGVDLPHGYTEDDAKAGVRK